MAIKTKKSKQPLISVIVPAYNVEKFIGKCLESILAQTHQNLELIVVDDGSTDFTPEVLKEFARADKRVKVVTQQNKGLPGARNSGLDIAKGEYLLFVDGDDYIEPDTLKDTLEHLLKNDADVCFFNHQNVSWKNRKKIETPSSDILNFTGYVTDAPREFFDHMHVAWNKLLKNNDLVPHFNESLRKAEDTSFCWEYYLKNPKITFLNKVYYNYIQRSDSLIRQVDLDSSYHIASANYISELESFKNSPLTTQSYILNRSAQAIINEIGRFYKNKKWPKSYRKDVYNFLTRHYNPIISTLGSYSRLRNLYLKQVFPFVDKIYNRELKGDTLNTTILGITFKKKIGLKEIEDKYIEAIKKNHHKYKKDTYLLSDCLYEQAECIDAYALFLYMRQRGLKAYYVMLKSNPLYDKLLREGNVDNIIVLPDITKKVCYYKFLYDILLRTKAIISSFGEDAINKDFLQKTAPWKYVFIQHGKTFLKESVLSIGYITNYRYMVASCDNEKKVFSKYQSSIERFIDGGQARWDLLSQKRKKNKKILVMFTRRRVDKDKFDKTQYKKEILSILQDKKLDAYLKQHGVEMYFALHHGLLAKGIDFKTGYKHVVPMDKISQYVKECSLLITDFSSISFDFMFQNKPVLFYMLGYNDPLLSNLDRKDMEQIHYKKYMLGNVFWSWNSVFEKLRYYIENKFTLETNLKEKYEKFFYFKKDIRKHIVDEIEKICEEKEG